MKDKIDGLVKGDAKTKTKTQLKKGWIDIFGENFDFWHIFYFDQFDIKISHNLLLLAFLYMIGSCHLSFSLHYFSSLAFQRKKRERKESYAFSFNFN